LFCVAGVKGASAQVDRFTPYEELEIHKSDPALQQAAANAPCKNASVAARLAWLAEDVTEATAALDYLRNEINKLQSQRYDLMSKYENIGGRYDGNGKFAIRTSSGPDTLDVPKLRDLEKEIDGLSKLVDEVSDRRRADSNEIDALNAKPPCVPTGTPPPPKPGPPTGGGNPPPKPAPAPQVFPTHRTTTCAQCQHLADLLNDAADKYAQARNRHDPDQATFLSDMQRYARELDNCEKACHEHGLAPRRASHAACREDQPCAGEGVTLPANTSSRQVSQPAGSGGQTVVIPGGDEHPPDEGPQNPTQPVTPDVPFPHDDGPPPH
jgi:hypothetical protein